ncbi:MAG TPA: PatB family C-S lyase [Anaerolineaceae bacterium]|nr:PatB family C-S lyase [Anaerolineaceae bacterium]
MVYNFDEQINRRNSDSIKWNFYEEDVLPFWVADMDFRSPQPVIDALEGRIKHGVFGYAAENIALKEIICERLVKLYNWNILPEEIIFLPGVVNGFNLVIQALTEPGQEILMQPPVYHPFLYAPHNAQTTRKDAALMIGKDRKYFIDFDQFDESIEENTKLFLLCNPHNPVGRVFTKDELEKMADICLKKNTFICSDEIHADIIYQGYEHIPIASLSSEIAQNTITLMAPSKTFNIAGLGFSFAIVQNSELRKRLKYARKGLVSEANVLGITASKAAYEFGDEWLRQLIEYLSLNFETLTSYIQQRLPVIKITPIEGTYLAWLDCRDLPIEKNAYDFFLKEARVAFNDGKIFGPGGEGFIRFNFGCPRSQMIEGLDRMKKSLERVA